MKLPASRFVGLTDLYVPFGGERHLTDVAHHF